MTTKQVKAKEMNRNPTGKGGFKDNPDHRHNGAWKKEDTPRYKLEQMMKLSDSDLEKVASDKEAPLFERKLAAAIKKGDWRVIKEMMQEVYGRPAQAVDVTSAGEKLAGATIVFADEPPSED